jgi:hypothetical protein
MKLNRDCSGADEYIMKEEGTYYESVDVYVTVTLK